MRVSYSGSRPPKPDAPRADHDLFERIEEDVIADVMTLPAGTVVVHGNAEGVDAAARDAARELGLTDEPWLPDPGAHGGDMRKALLARNRYVETVGEDGEARLWVSPWSRGTWDAWRKAERANVPRVLREYLYDGGIKVTRWPPGPPPRLRVRSGSVRSYTGPGRLDVTRGSGAGPGLAFAPTRALLDPAIEARKAVVELLRHADKIRTGPQIITAGAGEEAAAIVAKARALADGLWAPYASAFTAEMRVSAGLSRSSPRWGRLEDEAVSRGVRPQPDVWRAILAGKLGSYDVDGAPLVVAVCFCGPPFTTWGQCHARILAGTIWPALGAEDGGEAKSTGIVVRVCR